MKRIHPYALDRTAIGLSLACAAHCGLLPAFIAFIPVLGLTFSESPELHQWVVALTFFVSILAMCSGYLQHRQGYPLYLALPGCLMLGISAFFGHELLGEFREMLLMIVGSLAVAIAHYFNLYCLRSRKI